MGELDPKAFISGLPENAGGKSSSRTKAYTDGGEGCSRVSGRTRDYTEILELCSFWENNLRDQTWYPFKIVEVDGKQE
ncbi:hypothetical protein MKX03_035436, partial [Papaver bracteatum]